LNEPISHLVNSGPFVRRLLFVCSGNTCRSPMAAALGQEMMARIQALRQVDVASAGTSATDGTPASGNALKVMRESGLDLGGHRSRLATPTVIEAADLVLTMTAAHAATIARESDHAYQWRGGQGI